ncbi:MAG: TonB-dependent receptor [Ferruginibacter sp.]
MKKIVTLCFAFFAMANIMAQNQVVTGRVTDDKGVGIPQASIIVKGGKAGTSTDENGSFTLTAPAGAKAVIISSQGYTIDEIAITATPLKVTLTRAVANLDEVVVVGYGTQKKSVVTGSISSVKARDLENVPNGRVEQALQGRVAGVTILQNSGQPGSGSTIRVRGVTTFNNNNPLWVVDGVVVDAGGIGYLNQSDIESIEVLKDAASAAIYGTRAATGVILVTTKKGKAGKISVNYNGFYGVSQPAKIIELANATQYATLMNERSVAGGGGVIYNDLSSLGKGTDWQKAIFNNSAKRYLHEVSMSGGTERSTFYLSVGIQDQQGIVATDISNYNKKNIRLNSTHKISNIFTFGQTLGYTHQESIGLGNTNSEFGGPLSSAINLDPITPLVVTDPLAANGLPYSTNPVLRDAAGNPYGISPVVGVEMTNPLAYIKTRLGGTNWSDDIIGNAYLEAAPIKGLKIRTTVGAKKAFWGNQSFTPVFYLSATNSVLRNNYRKEENKGFNWNVENTITYNKKLGDHDVTILAGQGTYVENIGGNLGLVIYDLPITSYKDASFRFDIPVTNRETYGTDLIEHRVTSLFARLNYSYQDKYLFTGIVRRDGSTRFGINNKYGVFPSFSGGWNVNKEKFWISNKVVNSLKIRGGYGVTGNDALDDFRYLATVVGGYNYPMGNSGAVTTGYSPLTLDNPDLHWEETSSGDIGFDAQLFNAFNLTVNLYNKKTTGILRPVVIPGYVGVSENPWDNVADMKNTGVEVELGYRKRLGELNLAVNGNVSYLKNTVTYVAADTNFLVGGASFQSMGAITRIKVGNTYNGFWGYKRMGVFQNEAQIASYKNKSGGLIQPNARPGDFQWEDVDGDGAITQGDQDKAFLGSNIPKYTFGFTLNMEYKGFDFTLFAQGAAGNKIFQGLRRLDILTANFPARALGRWTAEGTSNDYPRLTSTDPNHNFDWMSDFYLEKGDYLRLKVMQLGYTLPNKWFGKYGVSKFRFYVTGENLLTLTNYTGYDPEVGGGVFGVDKGQYPQARAILGGVQLQF